jgi:transposase
MPDAMPDFESFTHAELVTICRALFQAVQDLTARCERLEREVQELKAGTPPQKTSRNSSLPPSTDQKATSQPETRASPRQNSLGRSGGGRPLHPNPDAHVSLRPDTCNACGTFLLAASERIKAVYEKIELPEIKPLVTRVTQLECQCPDCGARTVAAAPVGLEPGSPFGTSVQTLLLSLRYQHAISFERLTNVMNDVFHVSISQGAISNVFEKLLEQLKPRVTEITDAVRDGSGVMSDETSARVSGQTWWEWVFRTPRACLHVIQASRGFDVIQGVFTSKQLEQARPAYWVSDLHGAQAKHPAWRWQVCLAHQLRDCQFAVDCGDGLFAPVMLALFRRALAVHQRRDSLAVSTWVSYRNAIKRDLKIALLIQPAHAEGRRLLRRYVKIKDSLLTFLEFPDVPPTNNASERAIRWSVIFRRVTNGMRSSWGAELFAAVRSVVNSGALHGWGAFEAIRRALGLGSFLPVVQANLPPS